MRKVLVFSTPFCAKCPGVKKVLSASNVAFEEVNAIQNQELVKQYDIKGVPTIVVIEDGIWESYSANEVGEVISAR